MQNDEYEEGERDVLKHFHETFQECIIVHIASQFSTCSALEQCFKIIFERKKE